MPFQLSPGVAVVEKDFSSIVPAVSTSAGAHCGPFAWGPIEDPVRVSSETDLVSRFGQPQNDNYQSFYTCANFLSYTNNLLVTRTDAPNLRNAVSVKSSALLQSNVGFNPGTGYILSDAPTVTFSGPQIEGGTAATGVVTYTTNVVNSITNLILTGITITDGGSGYTADPVVTISAPASGTRATASVTVIASGVKIKNVTSYLDSYNAGSSAVGMFAAKFAGIKGNGLKIVVVDAGNWLTTPENIRRAFPGIPGTSDFAAKQQTPISNDEIHVAVFDTPTGTFSGVANSLLEKYVYMSKLTDARRTDGSNNYYKSVINSQSKYIWWMSHADNLRYSEAPTYNVVDATLGANAVFGADTLQVNMTDGVNDPSYATMQSYYTWLNEDATDKSTRQIGVSGAASSRNNGVFTVLSIVRNTAPSTGVVTSFTINLVGSGVVSATETAVYINSVGKAPWGLDATTLIAQFGTASKDLKVLSSAVTDILSGGTDDFASTAGNIIAAYTVLTNPEQYDISLIPVGNVSATTAKTIVDLFDGSNAGVNGRRDSIVFISPSVGGDPITNAQTATTAIIQYRNDSNINSSYAVMDSGWKYQYDRYNDLYRWVPLNGDIAGLCARTDYTADPWYSPGGFNRGQVKNVVKLGFNPSQTDRDVLYSSNVNPVVSFPGQGVILYGDKTMLTKPSAFDRINVRRLFIVLEKSIAIAAKYQMFEFNDSFSRAQFKNLVEPFLRDVQGRRGVTDFRVKCDESNNTGEVIDRNEFIADIFVKPARSINFITLNFIAARSAVSFEEIGA